MVDKMTAYCVFRLYGPMASYGAVAVGENRHTYSHPSKSAVMGFIAGALGIRREEDLLLRSLSSGYGFSTLVSSIGIPVQDYHTVQAAPAVEVKRNPHILTRKDEVSIPRNKLGTIISKRDYLCDLISTVCVWKRRDDAPYSVGEIASAISSPVFVPYLGRKSCPISVPTNAKVVDTDSILEAFKSADFGDESFLDSIACSGSSVMFWDEDGVSGLKAGELQVLRDNPLSRKRWQFSDRREYYASVDLGGGN